MSVVKPNAGIVENVLQTNNEQFCPGVMVHCHPVKFDIFGVHEVHEWLQMASK